MNKILSNKTIFATIVILLVTIVVLCFVATIAWFDNSVGSLDFPTNFGGSSIAAYFNGGDGSKDDPYQIDNPSNLYNLAWLQYLGYFNMRSGLNNGRAQTYFKLTSNIDMSTVSAVKALPPIGTSEHPFIGKFDGNDKTVSKLNVSNKRDDYGVYPTNAQFDDSGILTTCADVADVPPPSQIEFVAMFGVVGDFNEWVTNSSAYTGDDSKVDIVDSRAKPDENPSPDPEKANEFFYGSMYVGNMYVDNLVVKSYTDNTLVGLAAGYVAGSLKNFGVYRSTINLAGAATGTTRVIDANGNSVSYGSTVSKFSIVGDYDTTLVGWSEKPSGSSGDGDTWGGTIDMMRLNRRLDYLFTEGKITNNQTSTHTTYGTSLYNNSSSSEFYWNQKTTTTQIMYIQDGTVIPLNVDGEKMDIEKVDSDEIQLSEKNNYHTNSKYNSMSTEAIKLTNTGYIVGGGTAGKSWVRANIRSKDRISNSFSNGILSLKTIKVGTNTSITISDDKNGGNKTDANYYSNLGFSNYVSVSESFLDILNATVNIHGFHFDNKISTTLTSDNTVPAQNVLISKKYYTSGDIPEEYKQNCRIDGDSYEFVKGGLNFTVAKAGIITAVFGTFFNQVNNQTIFDLFKVERTKGKIDTFTQIDKVYRDNSGNIYYDSEDRPSDATLIFCFSDLNGKNQTYLNGNTAYYFEIPVRSGDYVIGSATSSSGNNAYLMYLDIGANGSDDDTTEKPTMKYNINSVDFVNSTTVIVSNGKYQSYADIVAAISDLQDATQGVVIVFRRDGSQTGYSEKEIIENLLYYYDGTVTVKFVVKDGTGVDKKTSADEVLNP